ncbi:hypothetical protein [Clostridium cylindrosporum]|uniref:Uncharacterized protein n=1 Tax=Clostridium cylindrosporum DSM 605 TaxID=1121307 RepID=A0A0J8G356_CLOCY|nr:hypothetical protein [Clostridium cylindrosporum]KMT22136.1 hypothetical protein CLCY_4c01090 [Clostridium cylindrosporum DSM 605]
MSAFLAPIHFRVYDKIQRLENITQEILELAKSKSWNSNMKDEVDNNIGTVENDKLDKVIDTSNIHGWLSEQIRVAEKRLAYVVSHLLLDDKSRKDDIFSLVESIGERISTSDLQTPKDAYEIIEASLLDGMPCDRVSEIMESEEGRVLWKRRIDVHEEFWSYGIPVDVYHDIRECLIRGMLKKTNLRFEKQNEKTFLIEEVK